MTPDPALLNYGAEPLRDTRGRVSAYRITCTRPTCRQRSFLVDRITFENPVTLRREIAAHERTVCAPPAGAQQSLSPDVHLSDGERQAAQRGRRL